MIFMRERLHETTPTCTGHQVLVVRPESLRRVPSSQFNWRTNNGIRTNTPTLRLLCPRTYYRCADHEVASRHASRGLRKKPQCRSRKILESAIKVCRRPDPRP